MLSPGRWYQSWVVGHPAGVRSVMRMVLVRESGKNTGGFCLCMHPHMQFWRKHLELSVSFLKIHNSIRTSGEREKEDMKNLYLLMSLALAGRFITTSATCEAPKGSKGSPNFQKADALHPYLESSPLGCLIGTTNSVWPTLKPTTQTGSHSCLLYLYVALPFTLLPKSELWGKVYSHILHSITFSTCSIQTITSSHLKYSHNFLLTYCL